MLPWLVKDDMVNKNVFDARTSLIIISYLVICSLLFYSLLIITLVISFDNWSCD
uniref:Uncharacterized protein n=1 Tax=Rhizophora mucronata TaxID=61149 RepID=A0A2P2Q5B0_RHIMU